MICGAPWRELESIHKATLVGMLGACMVPC